MYCTVLRVEWSYVQLYQKHHKQDLQIHAFSKEACTVLLQKSQDKASQPQNVPNTKRPRQKTTQASKRPNGKTRQIQLSKASKRPKPQIIPNPKRLSFKTSQILGRFAGEPSIQGVLMSRNVLLTLHFKDELVFVESRLASMTFASFWKQKIAVISYITLDIFKKPTVLHKNCFDKFAVDS
jgi:hypothetical protein